VMPGMPEERADKPPFLEDGNGESCEEATMRGGWREIAALAAESDTDTTADAALCGGRPNENTGAAVVEDTEGGRPKENVTGAAPGVAGELADDAAEPKPNANAAGAEAGAGAATSPVAETVGAPKPNENAAGAAAAAPAPDATGNPKVKGAAAEDEATTGGAAGTSGLRVSHAAHCTAAGLFVSRQTEQVQEPGATAKRSARAEKSAAPAELVAAAVSAPAAPSSACSDSSDEEITLPSLSVFSSSVGCDDIAAGAAAAPAEPRRNWSTSGAASLTPACKTPLNKPCACVKARPAKLPPRDRLGCAHAKRMSPGVTPAAAS
jgi:hypothetical protein